MEAVTRFDPVQAIGQSSLAVEPLGQTHKRGPRRPGNTDRPGYRHKVGRLSAQPSQAPDAQTIGSGDSTFESGVNIKPPAGVSPQWWRETGGV